MRQLSANEVSAVSGGLSWWVDGYSVIDCYYDPLFNIEICDEYYVPGYYYTATPTEEALIWTGVAVASLAVIGTGIWAIATA